MTERTAGELARHLGCGIEGDAAAKVSGVASPERAGPEDVIYVESAKNAGRAAASRARCAIVPEGLAIAGKTLLSAAAPKLAFSRAAAWLMPASRIAEGIHATAIIAKSARLGAGAAVGPYTVIEEDATVGAGAQIGAFGFVGRGAAVGAECRLYPRVTLYAGVRLGDRVIVHSGVVLGSDGFGYVTAEGKHWKFPQAGTLEIGADSEIGANTTIDRGSLEVTAIGEQVKIDNLVHIAHNCEIGDRSLIAAQTGIAGSCSIGRDVVLGGQVGIGDHVILEDGVIAGGGAGILTGKTIRRGQMIWGTPARPWKRFKEQYGLIARLPELARRLDQLEELVSAKR